MKDRADAGRNGGPGPRPGLLRRAFWMAAGTALILYIFAILVAIIYRHPYRIDLTREQENTLSPKTLGVLKNLKEEVRVILPFFFQEENPLHLIQARILTRSRLLLDEYIARQPRIRLEAQLDLKNYSEAERWSRLCEERGLSQHLVNRFIFIAGDGSMRLSVAPDDLASYDRPADPKQKAQIHEFRAQQAFTEAIIRIVNRRKKRIYALEDHREAKISDPGPMGLTVFKAKLEASGFDVTPLSFQKDVRIPGDCDLLLIAAPDAPFSADDRRRVNDYLAEGGRLLAAVGPSETGFEELLDRWNIRALKGRVYQRLIRGPRADWSPTFFVDDFSAAHPITSQFFRGTFQILFADARALECRDGGGLHGEYLLRATEETPTFVDSNANLRRDDDEEVKTRFLSVAVWRKMPDRPPPDYRFVDTRIVVLGDATPLLNQRFAHFSHADFLTNCVSWLAGREEQLTGESKAWTERRLKWSPGIERFLFWVPIFLLPGIAISFGAFVYFLRRLG